MSYPDNKRTVSFFIQNLATLYRLIEGERLMLFCGALAVLLTQAASLGTPYAFKLVFDRLPDAMAKREWDPEFISLILLASVMPAVSLVVGHFLKEPILIKSTIRLENSLPVVAQRKLLGLSQHYHAIENTGKKVAKINKGCDKILDVITHLFSSIIPQLCYIAVNVAIIATLEWRLAAIFFLPFIPVAFIMKRFYDERVPLWADWEHKKEVSTGFFCQSIINSGTVQGAVMEKYETERLDDVRKKMARLDSFLCLSLQKQFCLIGLILRGGFVGSIAFGLWLATQGELDGGTVVYLFATGSSSIHNLQDLVEKYSRVMRDMVAIERFGKMLDEDMEIPDHPNAVVPNEFKGHFRLNDVFFGYPNKHGPTLKKLTLKIKPGTLVALVGESGSGKSTLVKLLARVYDVTGGSIELDGTDIRNIRRDWYRRLFATVQQSVDIFDASIGDNVRYAYPEASEEEVLEALRAAHLHRVTEDRDYFPNGLDTQVGERGVRLSGGEQQRVGIARAYLALLRGARVLILDEATSNLDSKAERAIQDMVNSLRKQKEITIIAIAHRLSTIQAADHIYVIQKGEIAEEGDHVKLCQHNGLYASLVTLQNLGEIRED
jgi:ABC-type multidrug transport system fused ATPase/permease subunit